MKHRAIAVVLALGVMAGLAILVRPKDETRPAPPPKPAQHGRDGIGSPPPPAPPRTAPPTPRPAVPSRIPDSLPGQEPTFSFSFDDRTPLIEQVRVILDSVDFEPAYVRAWRSRPQEVADAVVVLLKDPAVTRNQREMGLAILEDVRLASSIPAILEAARGDPDEGIRTQAIRTLGAFRGRVPEKEVRSLFESARSLDEKQAAVTLLGEFGDAASLPFLEATAKSYPDSEILDSADLAIRKIRIENSPRPDVELVQVLHQEGHPLRVWAVSRIVAGRKTELAYHLRELVESHRKLPKPRADESFRYHLLAGLRDLGQELSPSERKFVRNYGSSQPED